MLPLDQLALPLDQLAIHKYGNFVSKKMIFSPNVTVMTGEKRQVMTILQFVITQGHNLSQNSHN